MTRRTQEPARDQSPLAPDDTSGARAAGVVELRRVAQSYGSHRVLHDVDLSVGQGEFVALLGPSGSGKSTILRILAGFLRPDTGSVHINGADVTTVPPHKRGVGLVFQNYALFPHLSVARNIAYPMKVKGVERARIAQRIDELVQLVRLEGHADKKPAKLSGGQQQRVALARALAMNPDVLLLDEPLSNLDANLRREVGEEIRQLQRRTGTTAIMVTHDRQEAFGMADRIAVLRDGRIEQVGTPRELYTAPSTSFMAGFVGEANLLPGTVRESHGGSVLVQTPVGELPGTGHAGTGSTVQLLIRPEELRLTGSDDPEARLRGTVEESYYYGSSVVVDVVVGDRTLTLLGPGSLRAPDVGSAVGLTYDPSHAPVVRGDSTAEQDAP